MQKKEKYNNIYRYKGLINSKSIDIMQTIAESILNPYRYHLSKEAKKRLKWMYIIHNQCGNNIKKASNKIGISRQWLSTIHSKWIKHNKDPRYLEPKSKAPKNTEKRNRIPKETEDKIVEVRKEYPCWGKSKISRVLDRDYQIKARA